MGHLNKTLERSCIFGNLVTSADELTCQIPVVLTALVLISEGDINAESLLSLNFVLLFLGVVAGTSFHLFSINLILVHFAGNLINTYNDFKKGVDTKASADDRTLVDKLVDPAAVKVQKIVNS